MEHIFEDIKKEMARQIAKWGEQNHPILDPMLIDRDAQRMCEEFEIPSEGRAKQLCERAFLQGTGTYMHILVEEVSESASCKDVPELREELVQVASVAVSMILSLERNGR